MVGGRRLGCKVEEVVVVGSVAGQSKQSRAGETAGRKGRDGGRGSEAVS